MAFTRPKCLDNKCVITGKESGLRLVAIAPDIDGTLLTHQNALVMYFTVAEAFARFEFCIDTKENKIIPLSKRCIEQFGNATIVNLPTTAELKPDENLLLTHQTAAVKEAKSRCVDCWQRKNRQHKCLGMPNETPGQRVLRVGTFPVVSVKGPRGVCNRDGHLPKLISNCSVWAVNGNVELLWNCCASLLLQPPHHETESDSTNPLEFPILYPALIIPSVHENHETKTNADSKLERIIASLSDSAILLGSTPRQIWDGGSLRNPLTVLPPAGGKCKGGPVGKCRIDKYPNTIRYEWECCGLQNPKPTEHTSNPDPLDLPVSS